MSQVFFDKLMRVGLVPAVVIESADLAVPLGEALLAGGLNVVEVTFRTAAAEESIRRLRSELPEMIVGAGTVLSAEQVDRSIDAGALFGVAPGLNEQVLSYATDKGLPFAPGVLSPSEIERGLSLGCQFMKFFPAESSGGAATLNALAGPYRSTGVQFMPTGGINPGNVGEYCSLSVVGAIGGSWMATPALIASQDWDAITTLTRDALALIKG